MTASDKDMSDLNMDAMDALFAEAATVSEPMPNEAFMARVLDDAFAHQPMPQLAPVSLWEQITTMIGGWQGMGGLVAATFAGFLIGFNPPESLPAQLDTFLNVETTVSFLEEDGEDSALFGFGWDMEEG